MDLPIIIAAFGTTSTASATYLRLGEALQNHFPQAQIIWTYSSIKIGRTLHEQQESTVLSTILHPEAVLQQLAAQGRDKAILQSLHLFAGTEFHRLAQISKKAQLNCALGLPLFTTPQDYDAIGEILRPLITARPNKAILVLGHGTAHPGWIAYYALERLLRLKFGTRIFVGVVEKYPDSSHVIEEIARSGFDQVCIIPFFLVAGVHYRRDIVSDHPSSWRSRLHKRGITVETIDQGLGMLEGLDKIIIRHIIETAQSLG